MLTIPADTMNASLIDFVEQCLARVEAEVEIRLLAARNLKAAAGNRKSTGGLPLVIASRTLLQKGNNAVARWRRRSRKRVKATSSGVNRRGNKSCA
jgi:hypothetical protein